MTLQPQSLADLLPEEEQDEFGFVWKKETRKHTIELVCYDPNEKEIGAIMLSSDKSPEADQRYNDLAWIYERVDIMYPDGITLDRLQEVIRLNYELYGA